MILPNKYLEVSKSLIWYSALLLKILNKKEVDLDICWKKLYKNQMSLKNEITYDVFLDTVNYLYIIGAIDENGKGEIYNVHFKLES